MAGSLVWRIARRPHALDRHGTGARQAGGRWNRPGTGVIYTGCTIAITALERFVHLAGVVPPDLVLVRVELPEPHSGERPALSDLPEDWDRVPPAPGSMAFGTAWARERRSLVLYVPSIVIREEQNAVINPAHPEFRGVKLTVAREFSYDPRMYLPRSAPGSRSVSPPSGRARIGPVRRLDFGYDPFRARPREASLRRTR